VGNSDAIVVAGNGRVVEGDEEDVVGVSGAAEESEDALFAVMTSRTSHFSTRAARI